MTQCTAAVKVAATAAGVSNDDYYIVLLERFPFVSKLKPCPMFRVRGCPCDVNCMMGLHTAVDMVGATAVLHISAVTNQPFKDFHHVLAHGAWNKQARRGTDQSPTNIDQQRGPAKNFSVSWAKVR